MLATKKVHEAFLGYSRNAHIVNATVTHYVIMPDHLHFFIRFGAEGIALGKFVSGLKRTISITLGENGHVKPYWQPGFFDHLIRSHENYVEKSEYVANKGSSAVETIGPSLEM